VLEKHIISLVLFAFKEQFFPLISKIWIIFTLESGHHAPIFHLSELLLQLNNALINLFGDCIPIFKK
jgi:hypothetical protein